MNLILIHGRAQEEINSEALKRLWIDTLKVGLKKSKLSLPIEEDKIFLPYYGDTLAQLVKSVNQPMEGIVQRGSGLNNRDAQFFHDFLLEVSKNANITTSEIEAENHTSIVERGSLNIVEKGPLNWAWVQSILRAIDKKGTWSELSIKSFTYDVYLYLTNQNIKTAINDIVLKEINAHEPCLIVGHSLGSIVGYNILRDNNVLNVCRYITVGSPLGLTSVKKYLKTPIKMPDCVKNGWFNAYDDRDVVALNPLDKNYFNIQPQITNKNDVDNQTTNRHGIEGYLNDKIIAEEIYNSLTSNCT